jgi:hypothetical protein
VGDSGIHLLISLQKRAVIRLPAQERLSLQ